MDPNLAHYTVFFFSSPLGFFFSCSGWVIFNQLLDETHLFVQQILIHGKIIDVAKSWSHLTIIIIYPFQWKPNKSSSSLISCHNITPPYHVFLVKNRIHNRKNIYYNIMNFLINFFYTYNFLQYDWKKNMSVINIIFY